MIKRALAVVVLLVPLAATLACGDDDDDERGEQTGSSCSQPEQCYPGLDQKTLAGSVVCLSRVPNGYCTHECQSDEDCCKATGECQTNLRQVCASFESTDKKYCFLSCESEDIERSGVVANGSAVTDPAQYCTLEANSAFTCRSTGGGSQNRKVCLP